jgi:hypothetical protein
MPTVLWIPIGLFVVGVLGGAMIGAGSRSGSAGTGILIGAFLAVMVSFPLLAIGLANT